MLQIAGAEPEHYPWKLTVFAGGAALCDQLGCFGPSGATFGGAFGRDFTSRWSFELEGAFVQVSESFSRINVDTGDLFILKRHRSRVWGGGTFLRSMATFGRSDFFVAIGFIGAFERQSEKTPPGILHAPTVDVGVKGGLSGGAGVNLWFSKNWGFRPEGRFYLAAGDLSGLRYTGGVIHKF